MDRNVEFLNYIQKNSEMAKYTINQLIGMLKDEG